MVSVTLSVIAHLVALLWWSSTEKPVPALVRPPSSNEVVFDIAPPTSPPRKMVVVVVGPGRAAGGGSPRGRDRGRMHALPPHNLSVSATAPPGPPTFASAAIEPPPEQALSIPIADVTRAVTARSDGPSSEAFEELIRAQGERLAAGRGTGPGGFEDCSSSGCPSVTMALDVSGRHVSTSRVSVAPIVVHQPTLRCELPPGRRRAVVRLLVTREGGAEAPRLLESSGHAEFDSCAMRHAKSLGFAPGTDPGGKPLDVWINLGFSGSFDQGS